MKKKPSGLHECFACRRVIRWHYCLCALCSWRDFPVKNFAWPSDQKSITSRRRARND